MNTVYFYAKLSCNLPLLVPPTSERILVGKMASVGPVVNAACDGSFRCTFCTLLSLHYPCRLGDINDSITKIYETFVEIRKKVPLLSALDCHLLDSCVVTTVWKMLLRVLISEIVHSFILSFQYMTGETCFQSQSCLSLSQLTSIQKVLLERVQSGRLGASSRMDMWASFWFCVLSDGKVWRTFLYYLLISWGFSYDPMILLRVNYLRKVHLYLWVGGGVNIEKRSSQIFLNGLWYRLKLKIKMQRKKRKFDLCDRSYNTRRFQLSPVLIFFSSAFKQSLVLTRVLDINTNIYIYNEIYDVNKWLKIMVCLNDTLYFSKELI